MTDETSDFLEPEEGDLQTGDHVHFYQYGDLALTLRVRERALPGESASERDAREGELDDAAMWRQLDAHMEADKFWPNVWFVSDHGNAHLMTRPKKKRAQWRRRRAQRH